ncbi:MAG: SMI1/KNR4 family protein, partial [Verrucomicrobia bacterium]|nr:SMI1/KNR4 family protein [Verrucomicrobiota bacterium]
MNPALKLGTSLQTIEEAEKQLSIKFPEPMREVMVVSNGLEIPPDWIFYPVFDQTNPRKTASHIVYENTKGRWSYMAADFICIAGNGTGNQLVLKKEGELLAPDILVWDHETNKTRKWSKTFDYVLSIAKKRVERIEKQMNRNL